MSVAALDERHAIGANNPPEATPFEAIKVHIDDLMVEARNWCDGAPVETQAQADEVSRLMEMFRQARDAADEARKLEAKPFDDGKAEVQARYAPLIADTKAQRGVVVLALESLKAALAPFLRRLDDEKRAIAEAARKEAEEKAAAAAAAFQGSDVDDLESREAAEALLTEAKRAEAFATRAANDKAKGAGGSRAVTLRSVFKPRMENASAALKHYIATSPDAVKAFLQGLAEADVRAGKRTIPGFEIIEERVPV